ncbi:MAG: sigma-70 family RNA polymerase sigma factor [Bacilli bacterium]
MINVEDHLGLAKAIAFNFYKILKSKYTYEEIESTAYLGLIEAAKKFDESKGFKFSTYATHHVVGRIKRMYRDDKWYNLKRGVKHDMKSLNFVIDPEHNTEMQDILKDEINIEEDVVNELTVKKLLASLNEKDKKIIYLYFYEQLSQQEISEIVNIHQASVSRTLKTSLIKMRKQLAC